LQSPHFLRAAAVSVLVCLSAIGIVSPNATAAAPATDPQPATELEALMKQTGLQYALLDGGRAQVVFDGTHMPQIVLHVGLGGDGPLRSVWIFSKIAGVPDQRDWPTEIFPWLLVRNTSLAHGSFGLTDDALSLLYVDKLMLDGLTAERLATALQLAALIVDDTCPQVTAYLGGR